MSAVVGGIPATALSRGVYTEQSLRERFTRVETVARRVGAIGDDGGSLLRLVLFAFAVLIMLRNLLAQCYSLISLLHSMILLIHYICSVADQDRGSGALLTPGLRYKCLNSDKRLKFFVPCVQKFCEIFDNKKRWTKIPPPLFVLVGSGRFGIRDKHLGSATLLRKLVAHLYCILF